MLMLKRAVVALCATLPVTGGLSADPDISDVSTWRWNVSVILRAQRDAEIKSRLECRKPEGKALWPGYTRRPSLDLALSSHD